MAAFLLFVFLFGLLLLGVPIAVALGLSTRYRDTARAACRCSSPDSEQILATSSALACQSQDASARIRPRWRAMPARIWSR